MTIYDLPHHASYTNGQSLIDEHYIPLDEKGNFMAKFFPNGTLIIARAFERCEDKRRDTFTPVYKELWHKDDKRTQPFNKRLEELFKSKKD
ncbi:hypothetical protein JW756_04350 [Candidatus Woesearchaeota archaeon]|nr:hypothetical protein [Candidatus Woesearchaeota archaeon]